MGRHNSKRRILEGKEGWTPSEGTWVEVTKKINADSDAEGIVAGVVEGNPFDSDSDGGGDASARRRQFYTGAEATLMEAALNLCEWKLKRNIKRAAFERQSKLLTKHMLPKDGSKLAETWYPGEQCLNAPDT
eukprot:jgi/Tetstr1/453835/TSEL_003999.t1